MNTEGIAMVGLPSDPLLRLENDGIAGPKKRLGAATDVELLTIASAADVSGNVELAVDVLEVLIPVLDIAPSANAVELDVSEVEAVELEELIEVVDCAITDSGDSNTETMSATDTALA